MMALNTVKHQTLQVPGQHLKTAVKRKVLAVQHQGYGTCPQLNALDKVVSPLKVLE